MNLRQILCYLDTWGKHIESSRWFDQTDSRYRCIFLKKGGDHYCTNCGYYLYTEYNFPESLKKMREMYKMWWEIK